MQAIYISCRSTSTTLLKKEWPPESVIKKLFFNLIRSYIYIYLHFKIYTFYNRKYKFLIRYNLGFHANAFMLVKIRMHDVNVPFRIVNVQLAVHMVVGDQYIYYLINMDKA